MTRASRATIDLLDKYLLAPLTFLVSHSWRRGELIVLWKARDSPVANSPVQLCWCHESDCGVLGRYGRKRSRNADMRGGTLRRQKFRLCGMVLQWGTVESFASVFRGRALILYTLMPGAVGGLSVFKAVSAELLWFD